MIFPNGWFSTVQVKGNMADVTRVITYWRLLSINIYLLFLSFANDEMVLLVQTFPYGREESICLYSKPWLLMHWLLLSPGHQQPWFWLLLVLMKNSILSTSRVNHRSDQNVSEWCIMGYLLHALWKSWGNDNEILSCTSILFINKHLFTYLID